MTSNVSEVSFMRTSKQAMSITFKIEDADSMTVVPLQYAFWSWSRGPNDYGEPPSFDEHRSGRLHMYPG